MATKETAQLNDIECKGELTPFERNRYFYGKLLTVRDFDVEQRYMNGKRFLVNRLIHGWGVVCGLRVQQPEDTVRELTISPGVALDCCGREIVIDQAQTISDVRTLTGYTSQADSLYLCLRYDECAKEPVPALANASTCEQTCCYSRIQERFRWELRQQVNEPSSPFAEFWEDRVTIYEDGDIQIQRIVPRWMQPGEVGEIALDVTVKSALGPSAPVLPMPVFVTVHEVLPPELTALQGLDSENKLQFTLSTATPVGFVSTQRYLVRAGEAAASATVEIDAHIEFRSVQTSASAMSRVELASGSKIERIVERYFAEQAQTCPECAEEDCVALARLVFKEDSDGELDDVQEVPLAHYVYSNPLLYQLLASLEDRLERIDTISVQHDGAEVVPAVKSVNFGEGLAAEDAGEGQADISARIEVQEQGETVGARARVNFAGPGVSVEEDAAQNRINVHVAGGAAAAAPRTGRVDVHVLDNQGSVEVDSGFGERLFVVVLGIDHGEYVEYSPFGQFAGGMFYLRARIFQISSKRGRFQIAVEGQGIEDREIPIRWWAVPGETFVGPTPTVTTPTITTPTFTIPTATIITPTLTFPTATATVITPTLTFPTATATVITPIPTLTAPTATVITPVPTLTIPTATATIVSPTLTITRPTGTIPIITRPTVVTPRTMLNLLDIPGVGIATEQKLHDGGIHTIEELASASAERVAELLNMRDIKRAERLINDAKRLSETP